jgi:hypothetical protein
MDAGKFPLQRFDVAFSGFSITVKCAQDPQRRLAFDSAKFGAEAGCKDKVQFQRSLRSRTDPDPERIKGWRGRQPDEAANRSAEAPRNSGKAQSTDLLQLGFRAYCMGTTSSLSTSGQLIVHSPKQAAKKSVAIGSDRV